MKPKLLLAMLVFAFIFTKAISQNRTQTDWGIINDAVPTYKFTLSTPYLTFTNFGAEKTNTHHYEFHLGYKLTPKDRIEVKAATWTQWAYNYGIPFFGKKVNSSRADCEKVD